MERSGEGVLQGVVKRKRGTGVECGEEWGGRKDGGWVHGNDGRLLVCGGS